MLASFDKMAKFDHKYTTILSNHYFFLFLQYFALNMISCASDFTLAFDWIDGNLRYVNSSVDNI